MYGSFLAAAALRADATRSIGVVPKDAADAAQAPLTIGSDSAPRNATVSEAASRAAVGRRGVEIDVVRSSAARSLPAANAGTVAASPVE